MNITRVTWAGQKLYCGIDVHKAKWVVTVRTIEVQLKTFVAAPSKEILLKSLRHLYPDAVIEAVYEAGCFGYHLADFLNSSGIKTIVVAPHLIPVAPGQFVKTDTIDSRKLAAELSKNSIHSIYLRPEDNLYDRGLLRKRAQLVKRRVQLQHQISSDLRFYGLESQVTFRATWSRWLIADLKALQFPNEYYRAAFHMMISEFETIQQEIRQINRFLIEIAESDKYRDQVKLLRTIPGIGLLSALIFLVEIGDIRRFSSAEKFASYLGLTPSEYSSGESIHKGHLTGMGHATLRSLLVQIAWRSIKQDPVLLMKFQRIAGRQSKCRAIIPVAKSLANRARRVLLSQQPYVLGVA